MVLAIDSARSSPNGLNALGLWSRISFTTASCAASSSLMNSLHFMVVAPGGAGIADVEVVGVGGNFARDVVVVGDDVVIGPPGSVVIATDPPVVFSQACQAQTHNHDRGQPDPSAHPLTIAVP
jgi:hypothetical protein